MRILSVSVTRNMVRSFAIAICFGLVGACSVAEPKTTANAEPGAVANSAEPPNSAEPKGPTIQIDPNGPADTVRVFCDLLREKKFREAIFLTNLRPAIAGLTENELKEFSVDFEALAGTIPSKVEINGEIISGDEATVTANLPSDDGDKKEIQTFKLRRENGVWVIRTADDEAAKKIRAEGKNYLLNLRIATHEEEARKMLERISKAELAHSLQNGGLFADMPALVAAGLLPEDITTSESTGYNYALDLATERNMYTATATPAVYGKSGKLSFLLHLDGKGIPHVSSLNNGGKVMSK